MNPERRPVVSEVKRRRGAAGPEVGSVKREGPPVPESWRMRVLAPS
jgi:hypothetical protein